MFAGSGYSNDDIDNNDDYDDTIPNDEFMALNRPCAMEGCKSIVEDTEKHYFRRIEFLPQGAYNEMYEHYFNGRVWCVGCMAKRGLFKNYDGGDKQ